MTPLITNGILLSMLSLFMLVSSHDSRKHEHYTFKDLREAVDGDSLSYEDQQRLFDRLKFWNCTKPKPTSDDRKVSKKIVNKDVLHLSSNKVIFRYLLVTFGYIHSLVSSRRES